MIRLPSIFRRLDTASCDAALDRAEKAQRDMGIRTRALRMDISCGDPVAAMRRLVSKFSHPFMRPIYTENPELQALLDKLR
jgi:hypothetical protein